MTINLFSPPIAFLFYLILVAILVWIGRALAGPEQPTDLKSSLYGSGEISPNLISAPGYKPFFVIALFFAILHLGVLMLGSGGMNWMSAAYLIGLVVALVALILG